MKLPSDEEMTGTTVRWFMFVLGLLALGLYVALVFLAPELKGVKDVLFTGPF